MTISDFINSVKLCENRTDFLKFTNNNLSNIEDIFYNSNFNDLKKIKLDFSDLIYYLLEKDLIQLNDKDQSVRGFIIILGDFYDRFRLRDSINMIFDYTPSSSVKNRLKASIKYNNFNSIEQFNGQFDQVLDLLNNSFVEDDLGYRARISLVGFYIHSKKVLQDKYQLKFIEFANLFNIKQNQYPILQNGNIQKIVKDNIYSDIEKLEKEVIDFHDVEYLKNNYSNISIPDDPKGIIEEVSSYAQAFKNSQTKNFTSIQKLSHDYGELNDHNYYRLERGTAIINEQNLLNQYIHSYGKMHQAKLAEGYDKLPWNNLAKLNFGCIDWGCGVGLASIVLHEYLIKNRINVSKLLLIEPSILALQRALMHTRQLLHFNEVFALNKDLESLMSQEINLVPDQEYSTINLFSNILDVPQFSINNLINKITKTMVSPDLEHYFICISPNIDDLRNNRIESFYNYFSNNYETKLFSDREHKIGHWTRYEKIFSVIILNN